MYLVVLFFQNVRKPFDIYHTQTDLLRLSAIIRDLDEEVRVVMEATGVYHLPILTFLKDECFFVATTNPLEMKRYRCQGIRTAKTDRSDSKIIAIISLDSSAGYAETLAYLSQGHFRKRPCFFARNYV